MFRPPSDTDETLEQSWQLLWEAYGYPRGDIDEIQRQLTAMDRTAPEYTKLETKMIRLVRLHKFRRAIEQQRLVRIERDTLEEESRALRRGGTTEREMELMLTIDQLRDELELLQQRRRDAAAAEPMSKFRKGDLDTELNRLRDLVQAQQKEIELLRQATKPKMSQQQLTDKRDALLQEIAQLNQQLQQELDKGRKIEEAKWAQKLISGALSGAGERAVFVGGGGGLPTKSVLLDFAEKGMFDPKAKDKELLMGQLIRVLDKTIEYWSGRVSELTDPSRGFIPTAQAELRDRWKKYIEAATFYKEQVIPNIEQYATPPNETIIRTLKTTLGTKKGQLTKIQKDLSYYQQQSVNSCLVCGETRQSLLRQERNDPSRVFCGTLCQNKYHAK